MSQYFQSTLFRAILLMSALTGVGPSANADDPIKLRVMTFNLRYASPQPPNAWPDRRPAVKKAIKESDPDILGTQEGLYPQLKDIAEDIEDDYAWIGEGRNGGSAGEFMAIFYKKKLLEPLAFGHFWLSDTPQLVASHTWGNTLPRMVTWIRFKDRKKGFEFYHWNTHFDHQSEPARGKSAELLIGEVRSRQPHLPVIVTGDFNQSQSSKVHDTLVFKQEGAIQLIDSWDTAEKHEGEQVGTFHNFQGENPQNNNRIDWILASPEFRSRISMVVVEKQRDQYPSDHFPVLSVLEFVPNSPLPVVESKDEPK